MQSHYITEIAIKSYHQQLAEQYAQAGKEHFHTRSFVAGGIFAFLVGNLV